MSREVADYIHYGGFGESKSNPFKTNAVKIGAAVTYIGGPPSYYRYALADWQSADKTRHGQVFFFHMCDHWNLGAVSLGRSLTPKEMTGLLMPPAKAAQELIGGLSQVEARHIAFLKPAKWGATC